MHVIMVAMKIPSTKRLEKLPPARRHELEPTSSVCVRRQFAVNGSSWGLVFAVRRDLLTQVVPRGRKAASSSHPLVWGAKAARVNPACASARGGERVCRG